MVWAAEAMPSQHEILRARPEVSCRLVLEAGLQEDEGWYSSAPDHLCPLLSLASVSKPGEMEAGGDNASLRPLWL